MKCLNCPFGNGCNEDLKEVCDLGEEAILEEVEIQNIRPGGPDAL